MSDMMKCPVCDGWCGWTMQKVPNPHHCPQPPKGEAPPAEAIAACDTFAAEFLTEYREEESKGITAYQVTGCTKRAFMAGARHTASRLRSAEEEMKMLGECLRERNREAVKTTENYDRIDGLRNDAQERERSLREALEKIATPGEFGYRTKHEILAGIASAALVCKYCKSEPCRCVPGE